MTAELLAYEHVPPGFEILIGNKEVCPGSPGGIWSLWWNVQLSDDPQKWDEEIRAINRLQGKLEAVSRNHRLIRAQMAEFCRVSPLFPESVDILCEEIGAGSLSKPFKLGCEGRNLLDALGYHDKKSMDEQRSHTIGEYRTALGRWLDGAEPEKPIDAKLSGFLGQTTEQKEGYVKDVLTRLESGEPQYERLMTLCEDICKKEMGGPFDTRARPLHCFDCPGSRVGDDKLPECPCLHGTVIDACLICTRTHDGLTSIVREYRRFPEEYILAYAMAINSWLIDEPTEPATSLIESRYMTEEIAADIPRRAIDFLGSKNEAKEWLAASLLKTLKGNQRWHDTEELIDGFRKATSYLNKLSTIV